MRLSEELYQKYLEELQELESFKLSHTEGYFGLLKEVMEDPHTKHIVESLAFFIARSHLHGEQTILNLYRRLFRQYFPYLWSPLPSTGFIQLLPTRNLAKAVTCKEGTEIQLQTADGRHGHFQTMRSMRILPIRKSKCLFDVSKNGRASFSIKFSAMTQLKEEIGTFRLMINCLNYFPSSWSLSIALRQHLKRIYIRYDEAETSEDFCKATFGNIPASHLFSHPMEQLRSLMNFPEQELFLDIEVPPHGEKWQSFTLSFDLGNHWPETLPLSEESFHPFVLPIINLHRKNAELIRCDGTADSYPILYPDPKKQFTLHSFLGIYALKNHKPIPLKPNFISDSDESYEIEPIFSRDRPPEYRLYLELREFLGKSQLISIDALWYQPWFDKLDQDVKAILVNQLLQELDLRVIGNMTSPEDVTSSYGIDHLTRLLSLKNQTHIELNDLLFLMNTLKINRNTYFKDIPKHIQDLKVSLRYGSLTTSVAHEYSFLLEKLDDKNQDLVLLYFRNVKKFLDLWLPNIEVEVTINAPNFKMPITIKEGSSDETSTLVRNLYLL